MLLTSAGVDDGRLHFLPNPIPDLGPFPDRAEARKRLFQRFGIPPDRPFVLYPVRCIRRKNVGEALLWSALAGRTAEFGLTLAPLNPAEQPPYQRWKQLASELALCCHFETGGPDESAFRENLAAADVILTTSVAEGFGMAFLESWLAGRTLIGRNLPEVTADFIDAGLRFDTLYDRARVPVEWIGRDVFLDAIKTAYTQILDAYGEAAIEPIDFARALEAKMKDGCVDFADLDEPLQERVIRRVHGESAAREEVRRLNPLMAQITAGDPAVTEKNRQLVGQTYSLQATGARLQEVYRRVLASRRETALTEPAGGHRILDTFLDLDRFRLIRL
jgi:glycosyltransferase involved in cell wall biosynthesis